MKPLLDFIASGSGRRLFAFLLTTGLTALNKKLGLNLDVAELVALAAGMMTYVVGGNMKEAAATKADAAVMMAGGTQSAAQPPSP